MHNTQHITRFARTNFRGGDKLFGIKQADRFSHMYVIGKTGTGKTTLLERLIRNDISVGNGCCLIDPHGDLVRRIAHSMPEHRMKDVIYLDVADPDQPFGYNPLRYVVAEKRPLVASGILEIFKKMWGDAWGSKLEQTLRYALFALLDYPKATLADITKLLHDQDFREKVARHTENQRAKQYWLEDYPNLSPSNREKVATPIENKVGALLTDPRLYRILVTPKVSLSFRQIMDEQKILLVNVAKGLVGEDSAGILGALIISAMGSAAFSRADTPIHERRPFFVYLDEFQTFTTKTISEMLSELRKFRIGMVLSHQYLDQLQEDIRYSVLGNVGTMIAFRLGGKDATYLAREYFPRFDAGELMRVPNYEMRIKLMVDGQPSQPFSARSLPSVEGDI